MTNSQEYSTSGNGAKYTSKFDTSVLKAVGNIIEARVLYTYHYGTDYYVIIKSKYVKIPIKQYVLQNTKYKMSL